MYAAWTANSYTITLDQQEGHGGWTSVTATYNSAMPKIGYPIRYGYTFHGYYTGKNGSGTKYYNADGTSARNCDLYVDTTLYAYWEVDYYTLTINPNGGSYKGSTTNTVVQQTYQSTYALEKPTRPGYTFDGWAWMGAGELNADQTVFTFGLSNMTLTARWTPNIYKVTLNKQNGSGGTDAYWY